MAVPISNLLHCGRRACRHDARLFAGARRGRRDRAGKARLFPWDFRGDVVHPSTLELIYELGLIDEFLNLPHQSQPSYRQDRCRKRYDG